MEEEKRKAGELKKIKIKRMEAEKRTDRIKKRRVMEERWELTRWITNILISTRRNGREISLRELKKEEQDWRIETSLRDSERLL